MGYLKDYECTRRMFWDGIKEIEDSKTKIKTIKRFFLDDEGIEYAIKRALVDYMPRTIKKEDGTEPASVTNMFEKLRTGGFVHRMKAYFIEQVMDQNEYDEWHHAMCIEFKNCIENGNIQKIETYGKAQKIVNMTMKTIYCLEGAKEKAEEGYFQYCHIPLDSITIDWFRNKVARDWYNEGKTRDRKIKTSLEGGPLPKWGNINFKDNSLEYDFEKLDNDATSWLKDNNYHYMFFVIMIREFFKKGNKKNIYDGLTPFEAEFYIWPEWQWESAAQNLMEQDLLKKLLAYPEIAVNNPTIKADCDKLINQMTEMHKFY